MAVHALNSPLSDAVLARLRSGDLVRMSGVIYGARDAAHRRLLEAIGRGEALPVDLAGQIIYYVGPAPAKPGHVIGPAGPTTSGRMDPYTIPLLELGVKGFIGKGYRSTAVKRALCDFGAVYFAAVGGAAALLARQIVVDEVVAYHDLGPEAIRRLVVEDFPVVVVNDIHGGDAYANAQPAR